MLGHGASEVDEIVEDTLWIGGHKAPDSLDFKPDMWIHCAMEIRPNKRKARRVIWLKLDDADWDWRSHPEDIQTILTVAAKGLEAARRGDRVLVTCHMGLNRSGLVTGCIMLGMGFEAAEIIDLLRDIRHPDVLSNEDFEDFVLAFGQHLEAHS